MAALALTFGIMAAPARGSANVVENGTPLPVPPAGMTANGVGYVGDSVFASFRSADSPTGDGVVHRAPADGSGPWEPVTAPGTDIPLSVPTERLIVRGDTLLLPTADDPTTPCADYVLVTPSSTRPLQSCGMAPVLGRGGEIVALRHPDGTVLFQVVASGRVPVAVPSYVKFALDGDWVWQIGSSGLFGQRLIGGAAWATASFPYGCSSAQRLEVNGRFAVIDCERGLGSFLIDLSGLLTPRSLPSGTWRLGDGFAFDERSSDPAAPTHRVIRVIDFTRSMTMHVYGWSSSNAADNAVGRAEADDSGSPSLAMLTESGEVHRIDLDWLGVSPTKSDDTVPPLIDSTSGSPELVEPLRSTYGSWMPTPISFRWTGHDPGDPDVVSYDVRVHSSAGSSGNYWEYPAAWTGMSAQSVERDAQADETLCFEVRAKDWVGNLSQGPDDGWSDPRCTRLPTKSPTVWDAGIDPFDPALSGIVTDRLGPVTLTARYDGSDDVDAVSSYDVEYRSAQPGRGLGDWSAPPQWQQTAATSFSQSIPTGGMVCFRARARDRGGNVSDYTAPRCLTVPYDDRSFRVHGRAERVRRNGTLGGTMIRTRDWRHPGTITMRDVDAREVWVRIPREGADACTSVTVGGRGGGGGCWLFRVPGAVWQRHLYRPGTHGLLRLRLGYPIDAVAVVR